jgi:hypothetical protein
MPAETGRAAGTGGMSAGSTTQEVKCHENGQLGFPDHY